MNRQVQSAVLRVSILVLLALAAVGAEATVLRGSLSFNGKPVNATFPDMTHGQISAYNRDTHQRTQGPVDPSTGNYSLELAAGTYNVTMVVGSGSSADSGAQLPGNLFTNIIGMTVGAGGEVVLDLPLSYLVHVVAPYDNANYGAEWGGSNLTCPYGPEVPPYFRLQWEPVPGVERYRIRLAHTSCPDFKAEESFETTETSAEISIDPSEADSFTITIMGFGEAGGIVGMPSLSYDDGASGSSNHWLHTLGGEGRPIHSTDGAFVIQVAHVHGAASSFWTTDLTLVNSESHDVTATLTFTPRDADGLTEYATREFTVPAHGCRTVKDVMGTLFGLDGVAGSLQVSPATVRAYTRTATTGDGGSFGQFFPAVTVEDGNWASQAGGEAIRAGGIIRGSSRTNLALAEIWGESASAEVILTDRDGTALGTRTYELPPFGNIQLNDVVKTLTGDSSLKLEDAQVAVRVTGGDGRVSAALSVIAAGSNDPITVMLE